MKMKRVTSLACLMLILITAVLFSGCTGQKSMVIGIDNSAIPLSFKDEDGSLIGFNIDLAREIGKRSGMEVFFKAVDLTNSEQLLLSGKVDAVMGTLTATDDAKQNMLFTKPYFTQGSAIVVNSGTNITDIKGLKGKTLGAVVNSRFLGSIESDRPLLSSTSNSGLKLYSNCYTAFMDLDSSKIDSIAMDESAARYFVSQKETQYRLINTGLTDRQQYFIGVRRNDSYLRNQIQQALNGIIKDGTGAVISKKWFGSNMMPS